MTASNKYLPETDNNFAVFEKKTESIYTPIGYTNQTTGFTPYITNGQNMVLGRMVSIAKFQGYASFEQIEEYLN